MSTTLKSIFRKILYFSFIISLGGQIFTAGAAGLPGEYLLTQRWRTLLSPVSPLTNPTFINEENYISFRMAATTLLGEFNTIEAGLVYPLGLYQSVGITGVFQGLRQPYEHTEYNNGEFSTDGELIADNTNYVMATYAYNVWKGLTVGANVNIFHKSFYNYSAVGISPDIGLNYRVLQHPAIGTHQLGVSLQNAIYLKTVSTDQALPRVARFSLNSSYWERQISSSFDFSLRDLGVTVDDFINAPAKTEWNFDGKIGGWIIRIVNVYALFGLTEEAFSYFGIAGGINIPSINNGRDMNFMVQYINLLEVDNPVGNTLSGYVRLNFGKHREEIYARKMAKLANLQPNDLYIKACNLYAEGNYWDAFFIFSQLFVEFPDFFKNDWVSFFLGSCQEQMDMRLTAEEAFKKTKELYPRSAAVPFADLGLMRVYYRDANFGSVESQFNELNKLGVPDSIKYHGYYYMGETEMKKGSFSKAKQLFDLIPETHPDYVFAQHSAAICDAATDNIEGALSSLENCIQATVTTNAQKEMVNRSYVFIGYIFYEELTQQEGPLAKAVTALRMVPKTSYFYIDALLGLGWTALKARQWADCKNAGQELITSTDNVVMKAEGSLLQAYAFMMEKNYNAAATLLAGASQDLDGYQPPAQAELMSKQDENNALRGKYTDVARKAYDLGTSRQSELVIKQIDSLHAHQKDIKVKIDDFLKYVDKFERGTFFSRNSEAIKEDVDYALAKSQKLGGQASETKTLEKFKKEDTKLDSELEELKKQLEAEEQKASKKGGAKKEVAPETKKQETKTPEPAPLPTEDLAPEDAPEEEGWEE